MNRKLGNLTPGVDTVSYWPENVEESIVISEILKKTLVATVLITNIL